MLWYWIIVRPFAKSFYLFKNHPFYDSILHWMTWILNCEFPLDSITLSTSTSTDLVDQRSTINIKDSTYIFMFHMFQHLELSVCSLCMNLWLERSSYFLDGHFDSNAFCWESLCVRGWANLMANIGKSEDSISVLDTGYSMERMLAKFEGLTRA